MIRRGRCGKDGSGRGVHLVKGGKKDGEQDVRQQTKTQALTCSSSLRAGRSAWIAVLAFNFLVYKETGVEERCLIFPISLRDKSCSDIQHAETKEVVSIENFFHALRTLKGRYWSDGRTDRTKEEGQKWTWVALCHLFTIVPGDFTAAGIHPRTVITNNTSLFKMHLGVTGVRSR